MGVLKRISLAALVLSSASLATGDSETNETDESKPKEASSSQSTASLQSDSKDTKLARPPTKESAKSEEKPLERLELDEEIESAANISLPQDI